MIHLLSLSETQVVRAGRGKLNASEQHLVYREQNQQQISIHKYISSGHYCAVMEPSTPASFQPPVTCQYVTLMKNAACFNHHNITILFFLYVEIK